MRLYIHTRMIAGHDNGNAHGWINGSVYFQDNSTADEWINGAGYFSGPLGVTYVRASWMIPTP